MERKVTRREVLASGAAMSALGLIRSPEGAAVSNGAPAKKKPLVIGAIADLHHGLAAETMHRLETFLARIDEVKPDFAIQLGDFCHPVKEAEPLVALWSQWKGPKWHVLGNHDMDMGFKAKTMDFWGMRSAHDSFDAGAFHFVILDCNYLCRDGVYTHYANANFYIQGEYREHINPEQLEWLKEDLQRTEKPTVVFTHQGLDELVGPGGCQQRAQVRKIFETENARCGWDKIIAIFGGHHHVDRHCVTEGIHYFQVNSASYFWSNGMLPYRDPLHMIVTLEPSGTIKIEGHDGVWGSLTDDQRKSLETSKATPDIRSKTVRFRPRQVMAD